MFNIIKFGNKNINNISEIDFSTLRRQLNLCWSQSSITKWDKGLPNLVDGNGLFYSCGKMKSFKGSLSKLENAQNFFCNAGALISFDSELPSVIYASMMFGGTALTTFNTHLPKVINVSYMFVGCNKLESFVADCLSIKYIDSMFKNCTNLKHFRSFMPLLSDAPGMFNGCILNSDSVQFLIHMLPSNEGLKRITIGCGCSNDDESKDAYAQEIGYESFTALNDAFIAKGWTVTWQFNGPAAANYSLRNPRPEPKKVFAKISEIDEDVANYTDGEKFYNLDWGHVVNDDSYEEFESFEAALEHFNLTEINRNLGDE